MGGHWHGCAWRTKGGGGSFVLRGFFLCVIITDLEGGYAHIAGAQKVSLDDGLCAQQKDRR